MTSFLSFQLKIWKKLKELLVKSAGTNLSVEWRSVSAWSVSPSKTLNYNHQFLRPAYQLQTLKLNKLYIEWTLMWPLRYLCCENPLLQTLQTNGFSPVWTRMWVFRVSLCEKLLLQTLQVYGFSPVWTDMCRFKVSWYENALLHTLQL